MILAVLLLVTQLFDKVMKGFTWQGKLTPSLTYLLRTSYSQAYPGAKLCDSSNCLKTHQWSEDVGSSSNPVPYYLGGPLSSCLFL